jgi:protein arginine kinase
MTDFFAQCHDGGPAWIAGGGNHDDMVLMTRASVVRNLRSFPFPNHASEVELGTILGEVSRKINELPQMASGWDLRLDDLTKTQCTGLQEMLLIRRGMVQQPSHRSVFLDQHLTCSLLINHDDHLTMQAFQPGLAPLESLEAVLELESNLAPSLNLAFDDEFGYLASRPSMVGTGLQLTALIHLPGLILAGEIDKVLNAFRQLQFSVHGMFGGESPVRGAIFQISNQTTLGVNESEIADEFLHRIEKVLSYERMARSQLKENDRIGLEDLVQRSHAILTNCRLLTGQEALDRLSDVRLGLSLGLLDKLELPILNKALLGHQSCHRELAAGQQLSGKEKSAARADWIRQVFSG